MLVLYKECKQNSGHQSFIHICPFCMYLYVLLCWGNKSAILTILFAFFCVEVTHTYFVFIEFLFICYALESSCTV